MNPNINFAEHDAAFWRRLERARARLRWGQLTNDEREITAASLDIWLAHAIRCFWWLASRP